MSVVVSMDGSAKCSKHGVFFWNVPALALVVCPHCGPKREEQDQ